jgi:transposase
MYTVGLDVGDNRSSVEILDPNGKSFKHLDIRGRWPLLLQRIEKEVPRPFAICFEASNGYGYLHQELSKMARRVAVAHPGELRLIFRAKKKHNRVDAQKLAKILYLDEVPAVHVPKADVRSWRAAIEYRQRILAQRVSAKNRIHALLKGQGIQKPAEVKSLWSQKGISWLNGLELGELDAMRRDILVDELKQLGERIKRVEKHLKKIADEQPGVALLMTIPGIGIRTAEAFCAYVDDIRRFERVKQVGTYFGLVPCQDATGDVNRLGHITRDGPPTVRKLLCEAAWQGIKRSPTIKRFFERVQHDDPQRKKIALVATAHYLVRVMAAMLRSGEVWRHEKKKGFSQGKKGQEGQPRSRVPNRDGSSLPRLTIEGSPLRKTPDA